MVGKPPMALSASQTQVGAADERPVQSKLQPPFIHHNQHQQPAQLGPRNTQGHGLIVNTVKTERKRGWMWGDDGMLRAQGEFGERWRKVR
ncbi:hypothetical protein NQZ68_019863 [Dissostichus eleginoides]|nr:hypothetical protein NQZ68_019863 [Dissostichus eleginoides]